MLAFHASWITPTSALHRLHELWGEFHVDYHDSFISVQSESTLNIKLSSL
jgi:hypothetical protein